MSLRSEVGLDRHHLDPLNPLISNNNPKTKHPHDTPRNHPVSMSCETGPNQTNTTPAPYQGNTNVLHQRHTMVDLVDKMHQTAPKGI
jgi:hypothetical protein